MARWGGAELMRDGSSGARIVTDMTGRDWVCNEVAWDVDAKGVRVVCNRGVAFLELRLQPTWRRMSDADLVIVIQDAARRRVRPL